MNSQGGSQLRSANCFCGVIGDAMALSVTERISIGVCSDLFQVSQSIGFQDLEIAIWDLIESRAVVTYDRILWTISEDGEGIKTQ